MGALWSFLQGCGETSLWSGSFCTCPPAASFISKATNPPHCHCLGCLSVSPSRSLQAQGPGPGSPSWHTAAQSHAGGEHCLRDQGRSQVLHWWRVRGFAHQRPRPRVLVLSPASASTLTAPCMATSPLWTRPLPPGPAGTPFPDSCSLGPPEQSGSCRAGSSSTSASL